MIKLRRMRWAGHVALTREKRDTDRILMRMPAGKSHEEDQDLGGRIILKWMLKK
jgi:hypothetical protein